VPVSKIQPSPITFHCVATNELGIIFLLKNFRLITDVVGVS